MYNYETEKAEVFTEVGQVTFLQVRDTVQRVLKEAGAITMGCAISGATGSSWTMMACVDRLVELGEIREVSGASEAGQDRIFVSS